MKPRSLTAAYLIEKLDLNPHPEGGYFTETYRSTEMLSKEHLPGRYAGARDFSTAIYFLLEGSQFSALHRIKSDELWHFYTGSRLIIYVIKPGGTLETINLGADLASGDTFQAVVKAGCWFGSKVEDVDSFALVGCTVAPGFDFADFEIAARTELIARYPQHKQTIEKLTNQN
jgi:predicted cupin superfamily sugar epimerase